MSLSYSVITPARDEELNLARLAESLVSQTARPLEWVVVNNGSTDGTEAMVKALAAEHDWITLLAVDGALAPVPGAPIVRAFHAGLRRLRAVPAVVVKLDADVSVPPDYFERQLEAFVEEPRLGIAGGDCLEQRSDGTWQRVHVTGDHVRGAARAYRWECLQQLLPLEEGMGWDGLDELKAATLGWRTASLSGLVFYHHRSVGARDSGRQGRWRALGEGAHYMGYRWWYLVLRALHHARKDPTALAMIRAYAVAAIKRRPQYADAAVRDYLRDQQSVRHLVRRFREATGRAGNR